MSNTTYTATVGDKEREISVRTPSVNEQQEGQKIWNKAWREAMKSGAILQIKLDDLMKEQGIWNDEKETFFLEISKQIRHKEQALVKGGIKLEEAKKIALDIKKCRNQLNELISARIELNNITAEGQADNARFYYYVSCCLVYNDTQKPVFSNAEDYLAKSNNEYAAVGASKLSGLVYGLSGDYESALEENKFLKEFGFVNEEGELVNKDGHLVDEENRLINDKREFVNEEGQRVDVDGNVLDDEGNYTFERSPFLDEEGNPVEVKEPESETEPEAETKEVVQEPQEIVGE